MVILLTIYFISLAGLLVLMHHPMVFSCPFMMITGLPCPGCGGMRATWALLHGKVAEALWLNPLSCLIDVFLLVLPALMLWDIVTGNCLVKSMLFSHWSKSVCIVVTTIVVANWIWNIIKYCQ